MESNLGFHLLNFANFATGGNNQHFGASGVAKTVYQISGSRLFWYRPLLTKAAEMRKLFPLVLHTQFTCIQPKPAQT